VEVLLNGGPKLGYMKFAQYICATANEKADPEAAWQQSKILALLLPHVRNVNALMIESVAWGGLVLDLVNHDWESTPRDVMNARIEMVQTLFAYGADPNAPYLGSTFWRLFSDNIRSKASGRPVRNVIGLDILAKITEMMVNAGANITDDKSIAPKDVNDLFPPRLASRVVRAMDEQSELGSGKNNPRRVEQTGWIFSWIWKQKH